MSLWTPYMDAPLDLTVPVKSEPLPETAAYGQPCPVLQPAFYQGYYQQPLYVSSAQISPVSDGSSCSSFELVAPRPVRAVPLNSPQLPDAFCEADDLSADPGFQAFERDALQAMAEKNGGSLVGHNPRMRRAVVGSAGMDGGEDGDAYRRQRARNNMAAKQSRDRRKLREIQLSLKVAYLKRELAKLKVLLATNTCPSCHQFEG